MKRSFDRKLTKVTQGNQAEIITKMAVDQAVILNKMTNVERRVESIEKKIDEDYVTQDQFAPVRTIVFGLVGLILTAVVGGLVGLVIIK